MKFSDSHNDALYKFKSFKSLKDYVFNQIEKTDADKIFCAYYSYNNQPNCGVKDMKNRFNLINSLSNKIVNSVENSWFLNKNNIDEFISLKPFCCTLTHNYSNNLCGGALEDFGFTKWGKQVVQILETNGIIIDTAHMGKKSFYQFIEITQNPLFNSHCGFDYIFSHPRNLTNEQISFFKQSKGYIGLAFYNKFFGEKLNIELLSNYIIEFINKYGDEILGIGTDFNGIKKYYYPTDIKNYNDFVNLEKKLKEKNIDNNIINKFLNLNLKQKIRT